MLWVLLLLLVFHCNASKHDCFSSCGSLNITYPFRLKQDPKTCGRPETEFELTCESESNRLVANLSSRPFYIKEISYKRGTIRAIDSVLSSNDCSSLPSFPGERDLGPFYVFNSNSIVFVNCSLPVDNPHYISTAPCISGPPGMYVYAMMGDRTLLDLNTSCKVAMKVSGLVAGGSGISYPPSNYSEIHGILRMGSELNWRYLKCEDMVDCWGEYRMCDWVTFLSQMRRCTSCGRLFQSSYCFIETVKLYLEVAAYYTFYKKNITIGQANFSGYIEIYFLARTTIGLVCLFIFLAYKLRRRHIWMDTTVEDFLSHYRSHMPRRYSYSDIKKITRNFKEKLGQGGYGSVFRGKLSSGRSVAVKMLKSSKGNGQEFINEVATVGRIHHVNVVRLIGFCSEGLKRALIYEFMPNGSLEKYVFIEGKGSSLCWNQMYQIALGIARGIEYLHRGCDMRILHFDIKPHNILLDENFTPKVSDFGLAKFYPTTKDSVVSVTEVRGTIGYIAPELIYKTIGGVSYKSDVYSFGMLLMEIVGRRQKIDAFTEQSSHTYFPSWIYNELDQGGDMVMEGITGVDKEIARKLIVVALWCIQIKPADRPSMSKVLEMLEGSVEDLQLPPKSSLSFPQEIDSKEHASSADRLLPDQDWSHKALLSHIE
ncbi:hypothetical protein AAC387_Pa10g0308 [Persea americana]